MSDNICPKCGHSGEKHILCMWEYFKCHELVDGAGHICDCKIEWKTSFNKQIEGYPE